MLFNQGASKLKTVGTHHYGIACDIVSGSTAIRHGKATSTSWASWRSTINSSRASIGVIRPSRTASSTAIMSSDARWQVSRACSTAVGTRTEAMIRTPNSSAKEIGREAGAGSQHRSASDGGHDAGTTSDAEETQIQTGGAAATNPGKNETWPRLFARRRDAATRRACEHNGPRRPGLPPRTDSPISTPFSTLETLPRLGPLRVPVANPLIWSMPTWRTSPH
jgi:hypothetical protein